jgi:DNA processing protein
VGVKRSLNPAVHSQAAVRFLAGGALRRDRAGVKEQPMELARPRYAFRDEVFALRSHRMGSTRFAGLWLAGSLAGLRRPTVAIVGPRAPSDGARARARELGRAVARAGVCVVSGLALGVDGAAHAGALAGGGLTIGVLGGGHRQFFPRRNRALAEAMIAAGGAVLSPFAPDEPPLPPQFLQRNGIVAALADAVVIVEAAARSGALNTASWAADLGIEVLAFPGDVDRPKAAGCNALIRDGATLVRGPDDVLAALRLESIASSVDAPAEAVPRDALEGSVLAALTSGPSGFDALLELTESAASDLTGALVRLELDGSVERRDACLYALRASA